LVQLIEDFICTYCDVPQLRGCFDTIITPPLPTPLVYTLMYPHYT